MIGLLVLIILAMACLSVYCDKLYIESFQSASVTGVTIIRILLRATMETLYMAVFRTVVLVILVVHPIHQLNLLLHLIPCPSSSDSSDSSGNSITVSTTSTSSSGMIPPIVMILLRKHKLYRLYVLLVLILLHRLRLSKRMDNQFLEHKLILNLIVMKHRTPLVEIVQNLIHLMMTQLTMRIANK